MACRQAAYDDSPEIAMLTSRVNRPCQFVVFLSGTARRAQTAPSSPADSRRRRADGRHSVSRRWGGIRPALRSAAGNSPTVLVLRAEYIVLWGLAITMKQGTIKVYSWRAALL